MKKAIYAGSFDPMTNGHLWVIKKASKLFDELTVAIGSNPDKKYMFSADDRLRLLQETTKESGLDNIKIEFIENKFLANYALEKKVNYLIRGIRSPQDYQYEKVMSYINHQLAPKVETIFLIPPAKIAQISSSIVKGMVGPEGWENLIKNYVPSNVFELLKKSNLKN